MASSPTTLTRNRLLDPVQAALQVLGDQVFDKFAHEFRFTAVEPASRINDCRRSMVVSSGLAKFRRSDRRIARGSSWH